MQSINENPKEEHEVTFNELGLLERLKELLPYFPREIPTFFSVTISCWAIAEILIAIFDNRPSITSLAAPVLAAGTIVAMYRAYRAYRFYLPEALINESKKIQTIYYSRKLGWQWAIALEMLLDRIRPIDAELERIRRGAEFIEPEHLPNKTYFDWLKSRPNTMLRLINAAQTQCTRDVPSAIGNAISEDQIKDMKIQIQTLADLYETTVRFERKCHAIIPSDEFERVHEMAYGWTDTIRDGINQFISITSKLATLNKKTIKEAASGLKELPSFSIHFEATQNMDKFCERLKEIDPLLVFDE